MPGFRRSVVFLLAFFALALPAGATELPPPAGPVVLTVAGAVVNTNRGPVDPFLDAYFAFNDVSFETAAAFDRAMLEALPRHSLTERYPDWPDSYDFAGPLLRDVLATAGATGTGVRVVALDGYAADIAMVDLERFPVLLALERDGRPLGIGDRGPAWVIWPREAFPELAERDETQYVWSAYFIEVE